MYHSSRHIRVKVLTETGAVPAVVSPGTVRDTAVPQEPHPRGFAPQTDTAEPRLQVRHAALTVCAALWREPKHANHCKCQVSLDYKETVSLQNK